ncbi:hypothetical protein C8F01DRAFT_1105212 [Mycena amicta]|nr:hypothetical protein C8F01DRAFT_1105212 [Mycena amicta]
MNKNAATDNLNFNRFFDAPTYSPRPEPARYAVRVTGWRLLNTVTLLGLGIYKAMATYRGQASTPTTLDWVIGVVWATISYWAGFIETENPTRAAWLFQDDWWPVMYVWLRLLGLLTLGPGLLFAIVYGTLFLKAELLVAVASCLIAPLFIWLLCMWAQTQRRRRRRARNCDFEMAWTAGNFVDEINREIQGEIQLQAEPPLYPMQARLAKD